MIFVSRICAESLNFGGMKWLLLLPVCMFCICINGCKPSKNDTVTGGGKGGNVTIKISPEYYGEFVDTCIIYVKYGTLDAPASGVYDDSAVCVVTNDTSVATFTGLTTGLYYFLGVGYHATGGHPPNVKGSKNCTVQAEGNYTFYLPTSYYIP